LGNGDIIVGFRLIKIGPRIDRRDRSVVGLSGQLVVDCNEKIIGDIGRIALELGKGLDNKRG
jgi:hypothetical protein